MINIMEESEKTSWGHISLSRVATIIMGQSPPSSTYNDTGQGLPFFQGVKDFGPRYPVERVYCTKPTRIARERDILFSVRAPIGRINRADKKCAIGRGLSVIRAKTASDADFIEFLLRSMYKSWSVYDGQGAIFGNVRKLDLEKLQVIWPPDYIRARIASILSTYDDLIENNRRRIQLLEQAARRLYKEWFVHFRFPGHEHTKITDGVPEGWEKTTIESVCDTIGGGTPSTKKSEYYEGGNITWVVPTDVTRNDCLALIDSEKRITETGLKLSSARLVPPETILMTSRASVGFFAMMDKEVCTNQGFINVVPHESHIRMYLLHNLMNRVEEIRSHAGGSTYTEINKGRFRKLKLGIPPKVVLMKFNDFAYRVMQQVRVLKKHQLALAQTRDLILPKLMSGMLSV